MEVVIQGGPYIIEIFQIWSIYKGYPVCRIEERLLNSRRTFSNIHRNGYYNKDHVERDPSPTPYSPPETHYIINATAPPSLEFIAAERERVRMEFFATYDVMTGVRIAATLGGFFGLMVFLVIYKSRGARHETMKALKVMPCMTMNHFYTMRQSY